MPYTTISCGEAKRQRVQEHQDERCHRCGRIPDCQGCLENIAYVENVEEMMWVPTAQFIKKQANVEFESDKLIQFIQTGTAKEIAHFKAKGPRADIHDTVQLAHMLLEAAAALTSLPHPGVSEEDQRKLNALSQHAVDGMAMVNGYNDDEDEDPFDEEQQG